MGDHLRRSHHRPLIGPGIQEIGIIGARGVIREPQRECQLELVALLRLLRPALDLRLRHRSVTVIVESGVRRRRVDVAGDRAVGEAAAAGLALGRGRAVVVVGGLREESVGRSPAGSFHLEREREGDLQSCGEALGRIQCTLSL